MTAPQIPPGPLDAPPIVPAPPGESTAVARAAWRHALRGIDLGAWDEEIADWVEYVAAQPQLLTLASLMERARRAGEGS